MAAQIETATTVDRTGESYYGGSGLYLMAGDGTFDCIVLPPKEGRIECASWNPNGREFVLVAGRQPAQATLFNLKGEGTFDFGQAHRNTAIWAPHGRFLMIGGFGNLAGQMSFWDRNKLKVMGTTSASSPPTSYSWSPDSRLFMTATTRPRMNVENGVHIFRYNGDLLLTQPIEVLFQAQFLQAPKDTYPDRPQSPARFKQRKEEAKTQAAAPQKSQGYVPPHLRGKAGATSKVAEMMRAEKEAGSGPRKLERGAVPAYRPPGSRAGIPGLPVGATPPQAEPMSKAAKNRARRKKKEAEKKAAEDARAALESAKAEAVAQDPAKKAKKLRKKLSQIMALKEKKDGGEALDADQMAKLQTLEAVEKELADIEASL